MTTGLKEQIKTLPSETQTETNGAEPSLLTSSSVDEPEPLAVEPAAAKSDSKKKVMWFIALALISLLVVGLVKKDLLLSLLSSQTADGKATSGERKILYWVDPMHPSYKSDKPGTAPDCNMDLVPVYEGEQTASGMPEGAIQISPERQQLIGVTYGAVGYEAVSKTIRAVGRIAYDETRISHVHTKIEGWIEEVNVDFVGKEVKQGEPLLSIYSPDLLQSQQEYLLALKGRRELGESSFREAAMGADSLFESAKQRLELWDMTEDQIAQLERTGKPLKAVPLYAPASGFVLTRNAYIKQRVTADTELYSIADLSSVWVIADIYEYEAVEVSVGQMATVTLAYMPGRTFKGKVAYIYPQVNATTRTLKARIEVANPGFKLKPEMFANVELSVSYGKSLVIPQEAVMDSGSEQTVFVGLDGGYFEPRRVRLGAKVNDKYIVLGGLKAGERIVTSGNFLIDSESKLKSGGATSGHSGHGTAEGNNSQPKQPPQADHSQHQPNGQAQPQMQDHSGQSSGDHSNHKQKAERKILFWSCSMHPDHRADGPGLCPECKMKLEPVYAGQKKMEAGQ
ncbi:MAG TPA: efflux RND transporter periplasmic adaptor subunit [Blastocatellia bacterium]|nr:efflux RND transporter periplasmic adaptor subunit [Blastocatellia bacterium]